MAIYRNRSSAQRSDSVKSILIAALWFGLVTGLIEGTGLWLLQRVRWLSGPLTFLGSSLEIIWISTLFGVLLFLILGLVLSLVAWLFPRLSIVRVSIFLFACLMFFDWLAVILVGRLRIWAIPVLVLGLTAQFLRWFAKHPLPVERFWRTSLPWLGGLFLLALVGIQGGFWLQEQIAVAALPDAAPGAPNILVVVVDTLRADHLSGYGYARSTSPNMDRLAQEGVLFENAFATSSWTQPSHASLLTGRYTYEHGADNLRPLDDRYVTIAEALRARGYRTGAFSANYEAFNKRLGFGRGFHHFEDYYRSVTNMLSGTLYGSVFEQYVLHSALGFEYRIDRKLADDVNSAVLHWVDRDRPRPFFAVINYFDVHDPYVPPQPYRGEFSCLENPGGLINTSYDMDHIYVPMTSEQLQSEVDAYDGSIAYVDDRVKKLLDELRERPLGENMLVVLTSDHGESFGEHGLLHHANSLYREVVHVPLVFWWPEHIPNGVRVATPVTNAAIPATLLQITGRDEPGLFPGPLLAELWTSPNANKEWPYPLAEMEQANWVPAQDPTAHGAMKMIATPQWHYITHEKLGEELYDWRVDPEESVDLAQEQRYHSVVTEFRTELEELLSGVGNPSPQGLE